MIEDQEIEGYIDDFVEEFFDEDFSFREHQKESIVKIISRVVNKTFDNQIIEAPTGSGKSIIAIVSAGVLQKNFNKYCVILASDLYLYQQYVDFIDKFDLPFGHIKGKINNYFCDVASIGEIKVPISAGLCQLQGSSIQSTLEGFACSKSCQYFLDYIKTVKTNVVVTTYAMFMTQMQKQGSQPIIKVPDVMICDECHNIPSIVQSYSSIIIDPQKQFSEFESILEFASRNLRYEEVMDPTEWKKEAKEVFNSLYEETVKYKILDLIDNWKSLLEEVEKASKPVSKHISEVSCKKKRVNKTLSNLSSYIGKFSNYYGRVMSAIKVIDGEPEFICKDVTFAPNAKTINIGCVKEDMMISRYLFKFSSSRILLSATVGQKEAFMENLGWNPKFSSFDRIPSTFDFSRSPIFYIPDFKVSYKEKEHNFPNLVKIIEDICGAFKWKRGFIQTGSYDNAKAIFKHMIPEIQNRMLIYNDSKEKTLNIEDFKSKKNAILVGPTLVEGINMPDDLCRFIIIFKVPYPSLASNYVKEKIKLFPRWYNSTTSNQIIQGIGRGVRDKNDYCTTFIIDGCFGNLFNCTMNQYPQEMINRIRTLHP